MPCEGQCCGMFHLQCLGVLLEPDNKLLCQECSTGEPPGAPPDVCSILQPRFGTPPPLGAKRLPLDGRGPDRLLASFAPLA